ncbi:uncharacterized protein LOC132258157 [Phlebotomus argentipes]|uniref:uncharacterized protein LOC132258157 n=1 Tax=Phlebotomus argentipes TaxID=94469 RepID=UPI002892C0AB|nr:uncharacterized protein LOC132258157 [Phlebotomus argentipes]
MICTADNSHATLVGLFLVIATVAAMHLPSDVELLGGYEDLGELLLSPEDDSVVESQSLVKAIRSKRSAYQVLESPGLRSHFRLSRHEDSLEETSNHPKRSPRKRRELESEAIEDSVEMIDRTPRGTASGEKKSTEVEMPPDVEELPRPEKQIMEPGYYRQGRRFADDFEEDSVAEASAVNEGIKARAPRVNFITQQRSIPDKPESRDQKLSMARAEEVYKKPFEAIEAPRYVPDYRSRLMEPPPPPQYKGYSDYYDKYRYPDYYEPWRRMRFYDTYMSRTLMPPPPSHSAYNSYPEHRFDNPPTAVDMRGYPIYPTPYVNDVTYPPLPRPSGQRHRRIIYYANLPEVVRSPPNVELRYRYNSDYYPAMETYRNFRQREYGKVDNSTPQPVAKMQEQKQDEDGKIEYSRNPGVKVISGLRIQSHQSQQPPDYRKYVDETKINDFPVRY